MSKDPEEQEEDEEYGDPDLLCCTWCGGEGWVENDDPLRFGWTDLIDCRACNGTGLRKFQWCF